MNLPRNWPIFLIAVVWFLLFWQTNTGQAVVGFRDSAYLYYPYFQWIDQQWANGNIPLWNSYCDLGHPVVADGTSSVFYPGKLLFCCRFLSYPCRYGLYLSLHVLLAAVGSYCLTKRLGAGSVGAGLAASSYAFGGSVIFQTVNVVYLVSAAWLPFMFLSVWQMVRRRTKKDAVLVGTLAALMILGGDPQMAYVSGLVWGGCSGSYLLCLFTRSRRRRHLGVVKAIEILKLGGVAATTMLALSAIQILPTYCWSQQSERNVSSASRSEATYQFSQPPWSMVELVWPNISGKPYPTYQRWTDRFPGADRIWTPSLYCGGLTFLLAISGLTFCGRQRKRVWLTWMFAVFVFASFGWYGAVWLYNEIAISLGSQPSAATPYVGGMYWLMTVALPKFAMFRYPAKLFVVASLCLCVMAGLNLHRLNQRKISLASVAVLLVSGLAFWSCWSGQLFENVPETNELFGPFDRKAAERGFSYSLLQAVLVLAFINLLIVWDIGQRQRQSAKRCLNFGWLVFIVAIADLLVANAWLVPQVASEVFVEPTESELQLNEKASSGLDPLRWNAQIPTRWRWSRSGQRLEEIVRWRRNSLHPKHNLEIPIWMIGSFSSIQHPANSKLAGEFEKLVVHENQVGRNGVETLTQATPTNPLEVLSKKFRLISTERSLYGRQFHQLWSLPNLEDGQIEVLADRPNRMELFLVAEQPAVLMLAILNDNNWQVKIENDGQIQAVKIVENNAGIVAFQVPQGASNVTISYRPDEFWLGLIVSATGWLALLIYWTRMMVRHHST